MRPETAVPGLLGIGFAALFASPVEPQEAKWSSFTEIVFRLHVPQAQDEARRRLQLEEKYASGFNGTLVIASGDRRSAVPDPLPHPYHTPDAILACAGHIRGRPHPDFVLGIGWFGPTGGVVVVYDEDLRKVAELSVGQVIGIRTQDVTGDGGDEILVWHDEHPGSGEWHRRLWILSLVRDRLELVWQGSLYDQSGDVIEERTIDVRSESAGATISVTEGNKTTVYYWDASVQRFRPKEEATVPKGLPRRMNMQDAAGSAPEGAVQEMSAGGALTLGATPK